MGRKVHDARILGAIAVQAWTGKGATIDDRTPAKFHWNAAGRCAAPFQVALEGYKPRRAWAESASDRTNEDSRVSMEIAVRCRQCPACLRARAALWTRRAKAEIDGAARTWFVTLTLRPQEQFLAKSRARAAMAAQGLDYDELDVADQFAERHRVIGKEITKFVKRLRKRASGELRMICVAEAHKNGDPHYHMLIHEREDGALRHRMFDEWRLGFTNAKLVRGTVAASYVCKYLAKSSLARVRASLNFGNSFDNTGLSKIGPDPSSREPCSANLAMRREIARQMREGGLNNARVSSELPHTIAGQHREAEGAAARPSTAEAAADASPPLRGPEVGDTRAASAGAGGVQSSDRNSPSGGGQEGGQPGCSSCEPYLSMDQPL